MREDYAKLFKNLDFIEPPADLRPKILAQIEIKKRRVAKMRLIFPGIIAMVSFVVIFPAFQYAIEAFQQSGFYQYFSLLFSDTGIAFMYWREFALSLAESLPLVEIAVFLFVLLVLLGSAKLAVKNARSAFLTIKLTNKNYGY